MRLSSRRLVLGAWLLTTIAASSLAMVACGSDDDSSSGAGDGGTVDATAHDGATPLADAAPSLQDATTADAGPSDAASDASYDAPYDAASEPVQGQIILTYGYGSVDPPGNAVVRFVQTSSVGGGCTTTAAAGGCFFTSCPNPNPIDPSYADADTGDITIDVSTASDAGAVNTAFLEFAPSDAGSGAYVPIDGSIEGFPGRWYLGGYGGPIVTTGAGDPGSLGPFALQGILPARLHVTAPPLTFKFSGHEGAPATYSASFPRTQDLTVSFTGGIAGTRARFVLKTTADAAPSPTKQLTCDFDAVAGTGTIPSQNGLLLLDDVDPDAGAATAYGTLSALGYDESIAPDGDAAIVQAVTVYPQESVVFTTTD